MEIKENYNSSVESAFDRYIKELYKLKTENDKIAENVAKKGLEELGMTSYTPHSNSLRINSLGINTEWGLIVGICILIACCGFLLNHFAGIPMYIGGLAFFLAGLFVGLNVPIFGLIFLFSHGATGLFLLLSSFFVRIGEESADFLEIFHNPVFSDGGIPNNLKLYIETTVALLIIAFVYTILHNLSPVLRNNKKHMIIILLLFFIVILLTGLAPRFFPYLIQ